MDEFREDLKKYAQSLGLDLFGVADLSSDRSNDFIMKQGGDYISSFSRSISIGFRLLDPIVDQLYRHEDPSTIYSYRGLYQAANATLDRASLMISKKIQNAGYKAYPIPASQTIDDRKLEGAISHKLSAHLSGLGWIGKSCLLITPQYGPRVRFATILTDAPLKAGKQTKNRCEDCKDCVDICPPKAFTGVAFDPLEPRDVRFRAHQCRAYTQRRAQQLGEGICGLCVYICPYGLKKQ